MAPPLIRICLVTLVIASVGCTSEIDPPTASAEIQAMAADNVMYGMVSFITSNGVREARVRADTAYLYADSAMAQLHGMEVAFYGEDGRPQATVRGSRGEWSQETDRMVARGEVVLLVHADSSRIESQEIHYDPNRDRIWSDSATVRTMRDGSMTSGSSFESDMTFQNVVIRDMRGGVRRVF